MVPLPPHASEMGEVHQIILQHGVAEARKVASNNKSERLCVDAAYEVLSDEAGRIGIVHAGFAMTALPHKRISEAVWERDSDRVKLLVESGLDAKKPPTPVFAHSRMMRGRRAREGRYKPSRACA